MIWVTISPLGCRTDGAINRCMGSVSATSGPDTELQVPDEILQNFGMKMSFSKDVQKLPNKRMSKSSPWSQGRKHHPEEENVRRTLHTTKGNGNPCAKYTD